MRVQAEDAFDGALPHDARRLHVDATSTTTLRECLSGPLARVRSRRVTIEVASWQAPRPRWSGRLGPLPGVLRHEIRLPDAAPGRARVRVVLTEALPFHLIASAALHALTLVSRLPAPVSPDVAAYGQQPPWLAPWANVAALVGEHPDEEIIRPYDLVLADEVPLDDSPDTGPFEVLARPWGVPGSVVVDATVINPRGYLAGSAVDAVLAATEDGLVARTPAGDLRVGPGVWGPEQLAAVRALRSLRVDAGAGAVGGADPAAEALVLVQFAMTGVVVHTPGALPAAVAGRLAPQLVGMFAEPLPPGGASGTEWEAGSVRQRRAALRHHATAWALSALAGFPDEVRTPSVSLLLAVTRPEQVRSALAMVAGQTYPALELVLAMPDEVRAAVVAAGDLDQAARPVEVVRAATVNGTGEDHADRVFAAAAGRVRGSLVTGIEADALYGSDHVWDLVLALHYSGAAVVGKACEFFQQGPATVVRRPGGAVESFAESLSDGPLLVATADLAAAGGWRQVAAGGGYRTHPFGFVRPAHGDQVSRSGTDIRTYPLTVVTS